MTVVGHNHDGVMLAEYGELLCQFIERQGLDVNALLAGTELSRERLRQPGWRLSLAATLRIISNAQALDARPDFGVRLGALLNIGSHGFLGYAFQSSRTLGDAFDLAVRYLRTRTSLFDLRVNQVGETALLQMEPCYEFGGQFEVLADIFVTSVLSIGQHILRYLPALDIELCVPYREQDQHRLWRQAGVGIAFQRADLQIRFPAHWLATPLKTADPQLAALAAARCEEELRNAGEPRQDLLSRVRQLIRHHLQDAHAMDKVAADLYMTTRTLRRRLYEQGSSYQALQEQVRRRLATEMLLYTELSVDTIADQLGYSDPSNFGRAFRRWTGLSPRHYRQQQRM
ncbi:MAG: AraC family transcriptional regulator [Marinobacter sp.]|nr:AraC family transcriptional regulator [Marinobacter sp.]